MLTELLIKYYFNSKREFVVFLGSKPQRGTLFAPVRTMQVWKKETLKKKVKSIFQFHWVPSDEIIQSEAKRIFLIDVFGLPSDYGDQLFKLMNWHNSREWNLDALTDFDKVRAYSLESMTGLNRLRYEQTSESLNLKFKEQFPFICILVYPMVVKIPIVSFRYFLDIHCAFAFNSIRKSKHSQSDAIISYLYEVLFLQQKIAISLHEYLRLISHIDSKKSGNIFTAAEMNAIMNADLIFTYLKASIEKIIILIGLTYDITNLDSKKTHREKLAALLKILPERATQQYYCQFMLEFIKSENLDELNTYRTGLLHKRGISDLQPHNYSGEEAEALPLKKIFKILHEQHSKNTAVLLGALAMLTDELVKLNPPNITFNEIPVEFDSTFEEARKFFSNP